MLKIIKNTVGHFSVVMHHKAVVFKLCCMAGIPWRGFVHDISKFTPTEFIQGVKYFANGKGSPITLEKKNLGYSKAWLHHKGRNKHHPEYWYDIDTKEKTPIMPYKYTCEMICDQLAAGIVYQGEKWTKEYQLKYWTKQKQTILLNEKLKNMIDIVLENVAENGIDKTINNEYLKKLYEECICNTQSD